MSAFLFEVVFFFFFFRRIFLTDYQNKSIKKKTVKIIEEKENHLQNVFLYFIFFVVNLAGYI